MKPTHLAAMILMLAISVPFALAQVNSDAPQAQIQITGFQTRIRAGHFGSRIIAAGVLAGQHSRSELTLQLT